MNPSPSDGLQLEQGKGSALPSARAGHEPSPKGLGHSVTIANALKRATVACGDCTLCCRNDAIILHPECGDDPSIYLTDEVVNPLTGKPSLMLAKAANGDCIYLDRATGCTIHEHAPAICREFDCARMYEVMGAARIRREIASGRFTQEIADAGRMRLKNRRATQGDRSPSGGNGLSGSVHESPGPSKKDAPTPFSHPSIKD